MKILLILCIILTVSLLLTGCTLVSDTEEPTSHAYTVSEDIDKIDIRINKADFSVSVKTEDIEEARLDLSYTSKASASYTVENGTLTVTAKKESPLPILHNGANSVTLILPKKDYESLSIDSSSGDITLSSLTLTKKLYIDAASSDINIDNVKADSIECEITSGDCKIEDSYTESVSFDRTSGNLCVRNSSFSSFISHSTSGDLSISGVTVSGAASFDADSARTEIYDSYFGSFKSDASSGDLVMKDSDAGELYIEATSGDISLTLLTPKNFVTKSTSGHIDVYGTVYTAPICKISVTSGDVTVRVSEG